MAVGTDDNKIVSIISISLIGYTLLQDELKYNFNVYLDSR